MPMSLASSLSLGRPALCELSFSSRFCLGVSPLEVESLFASLYNLSLLAKLACWSLTSYGFYPPIIALYASRLCRSKSTESWAWLSPASSASTSKLILNDF